MKLQHPVTHGACGSTWTGALRSHCPACCRTFNRDSGAERHRSGRFPSGRTCVDPATLGFTERGGVWYSPAGNESPWK